MNIAADVARLQRSTFVRGHLRVSGRWRRVPCACGRSSVLYASGYMFAHGRRERGVFIPCPASLAWNARVTALRDGGFDRSLPLWDVVDTAHGNITEYETHGAVAAERVAADWNEREGAWGHHRFTARRQRT